MSLRTPLSCALSAGLATFALAATGFAQTWNVDVDSPFSSHASLVVDGERISMVYNHGEDVAVTNFDPHGNVTSSFREVSFTGDHFLVLDSAPLGGGKLVLAGTHDVRPWVAVVDAETGAAEWDKLVSARFGDLEAVCVTTTGRIAVVGDVEAPNTDVPRTYAAMLEPNGDIVWRRWLDVTPGTSYGYDVSPGENGGVFVSARLSGGAARITKLSASGSATWRRRLEYGDVSKAMVLGLGDGGALAFLLTDFPGERTFVAVELSSFGSFEWAKDYTTFSGEGFPYKGIADLHATPDGGYAIGVTQIVPTAGDPTKDAGILKLDGAGNPEWLRTYGSTSIDERLKTLAMTPEGGFVLAAAAELDPFLFVRTRSNGTLDGCPSGISSVFVSTAPVVVESEYLGYDPDNSVPPARHATPVPNSASVVEQCMTECAVTGTNFGSGAPGTGGIVPSISVTSGACLGWGPTVHVEDGAGGAPGFLLYALGTSAIPLGEGTFYLSPGQFWKIPFTLDGVPGAPGAGDFDLPLQIDFTPLVGITIFAQALVFDGGSSEGFSLTDAVGMTAQ